jgi:hypothetical protein
MSYRLNVRVTCEKLPLDVIEKITSILLKLANKITDFKIDYNEIDNSYKMFEEEEEKDKNKPIDIDDFVFPEFNEPVDTEKESSIAYH